MNEMQYNIEKRAARVSPGRVHKEITDMQLHSDSDPPSCEFAWYLGVTFVAKDDITTMFYIGYSRVLPSFSHANATIRNSSSLDLMPLNFGKYENSFGNFSDS